MIRAAILSALSAAGLALTAPPAIASPDTRDTRDTRDRDTRPVATAGPAPDGAGTGAALPATAADNRRIVGVLEVRVEGLPDETRQTFQRRLDEQLGGKRYSLASRARMKQLLVRSTSWTEGCFVGQCITEVRKPTGAELVLLASLTGAGTSFGYVVTLVRTDTGHVLAQHAERCAVCTVDEAMDKATRATVALLDGIPDRLPDDAAERTAAVDRIVGEARQEVAAHEHRSARLGIALAAVGVAAVVTGTVLYASQGRPDYAALTIAAGGAMTASGIVVLTF